jgi:hypothetical protein
MRSASAMRRSRASLAGSSGGFTGSGGLGFGREDESSRADIFVRLRYGYRYL